MDSKHEVVTLKVQVVSSKGLTERQLNNFAGRILKAAPKSAEVDVINSNPKLFVSNYKVSAKQADDRQWMDLAMKG
jgi:hypothetical protein